MDQLPSILCKTKAVSYNEEIDEYIESECRLLQGHSGSHHWVPPLATY
jgi:hypothetical protein